MYGDGHFHFLHSIHFVSAVRCLETPFRCCTPPMLTFLRHLVQFTLCINLSDVFLFLRSFFFVVSVSIFQIHQCHADVTSEACCFFYLSYLFIFFFIQQRTEFIQECIKNHSLPNEMSSLACLSRQKTEPDEIVEKLLKYAKEGNYKRGNLKRFKGVVRGPNLLFGLHVARKCSSRANCQHQINRSLKAKESEMHVVTTIIIIIIIYPCAFAFW